MKKTKTIFFLEKMNIKTQKMETRDFVVVIILFAGLFGYGFCLWRVTRLGGIIWFCVSIMIAFIIYIYSQFQDEKNVGYYIFAGSLSVILLCTTAVAIYEFRCIQEDYYESV